MLYENKKEKTWVIDKR